MSRYTKNLDDGRSVVYGYDHALGYFIDVFGIPDDQGVSESLIEESSFLTRMSNGKMIELMDLFDLPESHIERVAMDLPIN
jgi:hypothetical protein